MSGTGQSFQTVGFHTVYARQGGVPGWVVLNREGYEIVWDLKVGGAGQWDLRESGFPRSG